MILNNIVAGKFPSHHHGKFPSHHHEKIPSHHHGKFPSHHHGKFPSHHHGKFLSDLVLMVVSWQGLMGKVSPSDSRIFSSTSGPAKTGIHLFLTAWLGKTSRLPCPFIPPEFLRPFRILVAYGYM